MGTVPLPVKEEPTAAVRVESGLREVIAGHPQGAVRRIVLYDVLGVALIVTLAIPPITGLAVIVAVIAWAMLATTDQLA